MELLGFRVIATGVFQYEFYSGKEQVCRVSGIVAPSAPVSMNGFGLKWRGEGERPTIMPGAFRRVFDEKGETAARVIYREPGAYEIELIRPAFRVSVRTAKGEHSFIMNGAPVGTMKRKATSSWMPESNMGDVEPYWQVTLADNLDARVVLIMLAFPMLRFAL